MTPSPDSYEMAVLGVLHGEFSFSKKDVTEEKICRVLKRKNLGAYDPERIALLRRFKDEVQWETGVRPDAAPGRPEESRYFVGRHGTYGDYSDFDIHAMAADFMKRYPAVPGAVVEWFVRLAVGTYYLL